MYYVPYSIICKQYTVHATYQKQVHVMSLTYVCMQTTVADMIS